MTEDAADQLTPGALVAWLAIDAGRDARRNGPVPAIATLPPTGWIGLSAVDVVRAGRLRNRATPSRLIYRPVGAYGEPYPEWIRDLRGKSGVYVIRDKATREPLYVGESHTGNLYDTLTRHLQRWRRWKDWWSGHYAKTSDHDPGVTYVRAAVEVAARVLPAEDALDEEARLIRALRPRDNVNRQGADRDADDAPF